ncbi:MAG: putative membrane protein insertion efficiency factor [Alphaproteobacteria bacterium MarineAlpha6_Bin4]|nr:MAG: putative membrane protein insertion efficiency factor [Alphaproteobacteria bacterium MarineAlpha6_Bin4]|tara:strand:- start:1848 stop:2075 length:228 start_codon:yes stop_codon:yes gene_type:complete
MKKIIIKLIKIYSFFSPFFYRGVCRFNPTCTEYTIKSIKKYGIIMGFFKSIKRLSKCHPFGPYGYDPLIEKEKNK